MKHFFIRRFKIWREYIKISGAGEIARRAFVNNSFDGVLTMVGVVMGSFVAGIKDPNAVFITGLSTAFAVGISGLWGSYLIEAAEQRHAIVVLEKQLMRPLNKTRIDRAGHVAVWYVSIVNGVSPFLAALIIIIPFLLVPLLSHIDYAYYTSLVLALISLFGLGVYLAQISHASKFRFGIRAMIAGIISIAVGFGIELVTS